MTDTVALQACERLILDLAHFNDTGQWERLADLFTEDGILRHPLDEGRTTQGRKAIQERMALRPDHLQSVHVCTNMRLSPLSPQTLEGTTYYTVYLYDLRHPRQAPQTHVGVYEDRFQLDHGTWRLAERRGQTRLHIPVQEGACP